MDHGFEGVLELLDESVGLEDVDDAHEEQEALPLVVPGRDATRRHATGDVHRVTGSLD